LAQVYQDTLKALEDKNKQIVALEKRVVDASNAKEMAHSLAKEIMAQYPQIQRVSVSKAISVNVNDVGTDVHVVNVYVAKATPRLDLAGLVRWLKIRTKDPLAEVQLVVGS